MSSKTFRKSSLEKITELIRDIECDIKELELGKVSPFYGNVLKDFPNVPLGMFVEEYKRRVQQLKIQRKVVLARQEGKNLNGHSYVNFILLYF